MPVAVGLAGGPVIGMRIMMMRTVEMGVFVLHRFVGVAMFMVLGEVQPDTPGHEASSGQELGRNLFPKHNDSHQNTHKGSHRKIGPGAGSAQVTQSP